MENEVNLQYGMQLIADSMHNQEADDGPIHRLNGVPGNGES